MRLKALARAYALSMLDLSLSAVSEVRETLIFGLSVGYS